MADKTFSCTVLTPERTVLNAEVTSAVIPAHDGEVGILRGRAPLLCRLGIGILKLEGCPDPKRLYLDSGFAEVANNKITILTENALTPQQIDKLEVQAALNEAQNRTATSQVEQEKRQKDLARCKKKLELV
ncbi:MAG TPA: ATP synthase F1 subunit epsilon [Phycisphaerae bacterium]|nr:ATP synthase F1 subunit epsilon [Phycisphaerae bacterium]